MVNENTSIGHETFFRVAKFRDTDDDVVKKMMDGCGFDEAARELKAYEIEEWQGNIGLNSGIEEMLKLLIGGTATAFSSANAQVGVGNGTTAAVASQTGLVGASKAYANMDATFPKFSGATTMIFQGTFGGSQANFLWNEFGVSNGGAGGKHLLRKVQARDTKLSGEVWTLEIRITLS